VIVLGEKLCMSKHGGKVTPNTTNVENVIKEGIFNEK